MKYLTLFSFFILIAQTQAQIIPDEYIVILGEKVSSERIVSEHQIQPGRFYNRAINGFSAHLSEREKTKLLNDHRVIHIEPDQLIRLSQAWGIDRIDQRTLPLNNNYDYLFTGLGVTAYIIDTGIFYEHEEFAGRATFGFDAFGGTGEDCHGHGTHVSGTVGGETYGVAKDVFLKAVRVLDCDGSGKLSGVIAGIDWVIQNAVSPAVANLSFGSSSVSFALDQAIHNMIFSGVQAVIAAGNSNRDACTSSPARIPDAITIGATGINDNRTSWSNYGVCVDFFAPGEDILSAWIGGVSDSKIISGTSMAAPHVTGVAALYLQNHPFASYQAVRDHLLSFSTKNLVSASNTPNNHLLYSLEEMSGSGDYFSPHIQITTPLNNSNVARGKVLTVKSIPTDNIGVTSVKLYVNGIHQCTVTSAPFSCNWKVPNQRNQAYYLQTVATDPSGNTAASYYVLVNSK